MKTSKKKKELMRTASGAVLLAILAASGYLAICDEEKATVSMPVFVEMIDSEAVSQNSVDETRRILNEQREKEIEMLDDVILHGEKDSEEVKCALNQKSQIAKRMEMEAQTLAALALLGYHSAAVVCGEHSITVFAPYYYLEDSTERVRIVDCICTQTGILPENVKIILSKNE